MAILQTSRRFTLLCLALGLAASAFANESVTLYKTVTYQSIWGFGAAANHPVKELQDNYSSTTRNQILDRLFSATDSNAGLSIVRLEINGFTKAEDPDQSTFMPSAGVIDWDSDQYQRWFAQEAENRGLFQFYAVPWTPPAWMKTNNSPYNGGHLSTSKYDTFADYIKTYVDHYRNVFGFNIKWVSIQNEPDLATPYASCQYYTAEMDVVAGKVADAVHSLGQGVQVGAPENSNRSSANYYLPRLSSATMDKLDFIAVHDYGYFATVPTYGKPVFSTEVCDFQSGPDSSITDGLAWGNKIADSLKSGAPGWMYWWCVAPAGESTRQGLINLKTDGTYIANKRLYVLGQFSRYLRPGYIRVLASSSSSNLVAIGAQNLIGRAYVVIINNSSSSVTTNINGFTLAHVTGHRTSASESLAILPTLTVNGGSVTVTLPPNSISSYREYP